MAVDLTNGTHPRLLLVWAEMSSDARHHDGLSPDLSRTFSVTWVKEERGQRDCDKIFTFMPPVQYDEVLLDE